MSTSTEYLAQADEFDNIGYYSVSQPERERYARLAQEFRREAIVADEQDRSDCRPGA